MVTPPIPANVQAALDSYPSAARKKCLFFRKLVFEVVRENGLATPEETLKWGEPAYLVKGGSTLRMAWKPSNPDRCSLYFNCQTTLLETFREIYPDVFHYDGKRAIHISIKEDHSAPALRHCIALTLMYHKLKHLPLLGA
ncbi:MAG: DUF1801 domain-containing protein [Candidatus Azotimanducaceae bacterium WSBS_2022_MAG_OTU7]